MRDKLNAFYCTDTIFHCTAVLCSLNPILQALMATSFTWFLTALGKYRILFSFQLELIGAPTNNTNVTTTAAAVYMDQTLAIVAGGGA